MTLTEDEAREQLTLLFRDSLEWKMHGDPELVLSVLKEHPCLAAETFPRVHLQGHYCGDHNGSQSSPLAFLLMRSAPMSLSTIQYVYELYPDVLGQSQGANGNLPLHIACSNDSTPLAVVQFLAQQFPPALRAENKLGYLPLAGITVRLRTAGSSVHTQHRLAKLRALLELDPDVLLQTNHNNNHHNDGYNVLERAFGDGHNRHVLEMLCEFYPHSRVHRFAMRGSDITLERAQVLADGVLRPSAGHLTELQLNAFVWTKPGWLHLMQSLINNDENTCGCCQSITNLELSLPRELLFRSARSREMLKHLMEERNSPALSRLGLSFVSQRFVLHDGNHDSDDDTDDTDEEPHDGRALEKICSGLQQGSRSDAPHLTLAHVRFPLMPVLQQFLNQASGAVQVLEIRNLTIDMEDQQLPESTTTSKTNTTSLRGGPMIAATTTTSRRMHTLILQDTCLQLSYLNWLLCQLATTVPTLRFLTMDDIDVSRRTEMDPLNPVPQGINVTMITDGIVSMVDQPNLESLVVNAKNFPADNKVDTDRVCRALITNQTLKCFVVPCCCRTRDQCAQLAKVLERDNMTLTQVGLQEVNLRERAACSEERDRILYYAALNQYGRGMVRASNISSSEFVELLCTAASSVSGEGIEDDEGKEGIHPSSPFNVTFNVYFGLLRESPSLWSGCAR